MGFLKLKPGKFLKHFADSEKLFFLNPNFSGQPGKSGPHAKIDGSKQILKKNFL